MCGIYGVLSYKDKLKDMNELVDLLGMESAERGTDATGVAYSILGNMKINKSAVSAYTVTYKHLRAHETGRKLVCRHLNEKKKIYILMASTSLNEKI